ncbi:MAG: FAD-dependent oxidoreductase [Clostridiales bacterium]|nr:FAD-dependent oxidoreductase [Clostridiales bacterium]
MIRINQMKLPIHHKKEQLEQKIQKVLKITPEQLKEYHIAKKSIDARKKPELFYVYSIDVVVSNEKKVLKRVNDNNVMLTVSKKYTFPVREKSSFAYPPIVVGAGPAGLFCAYALSLQGYTPIVVERGKKVEDRTKDVQRFWETGIPDTSSNVQFGEGGAGTFSDGKLNTLVKDPAGRNRFVLETFVKFGAPEHILYENKPHIGTDILAEVIKRMRLFLQEQGATFRFETCVTDILVSAGKITGIKVNDTEILKTDCLVLAIGHSARDTFSMLLSKNLRMEPKSFAVGFRVEHPQEEINLIQYGERYAKELPAAPYKLTANLENQRGVYSFCMCPGGYVVNASSEKGRLAVNGMSYAGRDGKNANSAIIVSVTPEDFRELCPDAPEDALIGVRFQEVLEERAFRLGEGKIPQQLFGDFCNNQPSTAYGAYESETKGEHVLCNLRGLLPEKLEESFMEGMHHFSHAIPNYDRKDAILSGIESRTSSPVRINRGADFMANIRGIYPCGEGAGYAGGIMSAAMDGLKVAEAIVTCK